MSVTRVPVTSKPFAPMIELLMTISPLVASNDSAATVELMLAMLIVCVAVELLAMPAALANVSPLPVIVYAPDVAAKMMLRTVPLEMLLFDVPPAASVNHGMIC
ncbi:MAG: hypothetical protein ACKOSQ_02875 [Planctomycetaceae bacterium]